MKILSHNNGFFEWFDISIWDVLVDGDLANYYNKNEIENGYCSKLLSI